MTRSSATRLATVTLAAASLLALAAYPSSAAGRSPVAATPARGATGALGILRLNQQGYLPGETKQARLMAPTRQPGPTTFTVTDAAGHVVLRGSVPAVPAGSWNARYPEVYVLDLSAVRAPGTYRLSTRGGIPTVPATFAVAGASSIYGTVLSDGIAFDQAQRDGADVIPGALDRRPAHLTDRAATVYAWPTMEPDSDLITDPDLTPVGGPVDVAGGWFDAGDYLKFTHSTAYADVILYTSAQLLGDRAPTTLLAEARHGEQWLAKMWDPATGVLYLQVGIGSGNEAGTFTGDHDHWRLPQADDSDRAAADRYVSHRPVFAANEPGALISPNLVGRVSAAFALAAQADAAAQPTRARAELHLATSLYARAAVDDPPAQLVTALPFAFYPESTWRDDMELGAAEIALAAHRLGQPAQRYVRDGARFARDFAAEGSTDTLNLYDTSALADVALAHAMSAVHVGGLAVTRHDLVAHLQRQIGTGVAHAATDPFGAAASVDDFDVNSHSYGLIATVALYDRLTHTSDYQGFASTVRTWLLGGDPWGVSSMVGVGTRFPDCMQHQVANLEGSTDGTLPLDVGAVVNGPNGADNFDGGLGGFMGGMVRCTSAADHLTRFDGAGSRYVDDVRAWQTDEPALDMTGAAIIAAAAQLSLHPGAVVR